MTKLIYAAVAVIGGVLFAREIQREKKGKDERSNGTDDRGAFGAYNRNRIPRVGSGNVGDGKNGQLKDGQAVPSATPVDFATKPNTLSVNANPVDSEPGVPVSENKA